MPKKQYKIGKVRTAFIFLRYEAGRAVFFLESGHYQFLSGINRDASTGQWFV